MKATDLRIGNYVNYKIVDELDKQKKWYELTEISPSDLRILQNKHEMNQDYKPITLNEEWLINLGFKKLADGFLSKNLKIRSTKLEINIKNKITCITYNNNNFEPIDVVHLKYVKYIHQLQNLYYSLTGKELTLKK